MIVPGMAVRNALRNACRPGSFQGELVEAARAASRSFGARRSRCWDVVRYAGEPPVVVEQLVAGVETDQAPLRHSGDIAADLDDVVFQLANPLAVWNCARLC